MTPDLAVPERRALYLLIVGIRRTANRSKSIERTSLLVDKGLAKVESDGEVCATEEGREWLRALLRR